MLRNEVGYDVKWDSSGERIAEGCCSGPDWISHQSRYKLAEQFVKGNDVLDLACGTGYGSYMLAMAGARSVIGVDISPEAIALGNENYRHPALRLVVGNGESALHIRATNTYSSSPGRKPLVHLKIT